MNKTNVNANINTDISTNKDTVFYDAQCPICAKEIMRLKQWSTHHIQFMDINGLDSNLLENKELAQQGINKAWLYEELHLRTKQGQWLTGIKANVRAWQYTPFAKLVALLEHPIIFPISEFAYNIWLKYYQAQRRKRIGTDCENSCDRR